MVSNSGRSCARCGKELTDAASMEVGIGPICRNLDNCLLAKLIPSNIDRAREALAELDLTSLAPETLPTLSEVVSDINAETAASVDDWRKTVKRIEWALSFPGNHNFRPMLTSCVSALGYVGLAAMWDGKAASGKAEVSVKDGRFAIVGPRNKAFNTAAKKINGWKFRPAGTVFEKKACWTFPCDQWGAVFETVITHYPNFSGLDASIEEAKKVVEARLAEKQALREEEEKAAIEAVPAAVVAPAPVQTVQAAKKCSITSAGVLLKVATPYKPEYINELKETIKWGDRRWNAQERVWEVAANHEAEVKALVTKHFGAEAL